MQGCATGSVCRDCHRELDQLSFFPRDWPRAELRQAASCPMTIGKTVAIATLMSCGGALNEVVATAYCCTAQRHLVRFKFPILRTADSARGTPASTIRASFHDFVRTPAALTSRHVRDDCRPIRRGECIGKSSSRRFSIPHDRGHVKDRPPLSKRKDPGGRNTAGHSVHGASGRGASTPDARADRAWP